MTVAVEKRTTVKKPRRGEIWSVQTKRGIWRYLIISNDLGNEMSRIVMGVSVIKGQKRKPTQKQYGENVIMFENMATLAQENLIEKVGEVKGDFNFYLEAVSAELSTPQRGVEYLNIKPSHNIQQWATYYVELEGDYSVQGGRRLVAVVSNSILNRTGKITIIPCTTKEKHSIPTHVFIPQSAGIPQDSTLLLEQMVTVDASKFLDEVTGLPLPMQGVIPEEYREKILFAKEIATSPEIKTTGDVRMKLNKIFNKRTVKNA